MNGKATIDDGIALHTTGKLDAAEKIYRNILAAEPNNPDALHLLGALKNTQRQYREALNLVNTALAINRATIFLNTRGMIFIDMGHYEEAANDLRAALKADPNYPEALNNLAVIYLKTGKLTKALELAKSAVHNKDAFPQGWLTLGNVYFEKHEFDSARDCFNRALSLDSAASLAHINLSKISYMQGDMAQARSEFEALVDRGLNTVDVAYPLAQILISSGELAKAAEVMLSSYKATTDWSGLPGLIQQDAFFSVLWQVCGYFTDVVGRFSDAVDIYQKTVEHVPQMGHLIWVNIAKIYFDIHRIDEGIAFCQKAIESKKTTPYAQAMAYNNMGVFYLGKEDSVSAIECFNKALEIDPGQVLPLGWLLKEKSHICDWEGFAKLRDDVNAIRQTNNTSSISPFTPLAVYDDPQALKYWASLSAHDIFDATARQSAPMVLPAQRKPGKIRIGYYSFDFRDHPVAHLTARVFELHNKKDFEVFAYSYGPDDGSVVRQRIKDNADHFIDVKDLSVLETAQRIAADDIDFLVDLTGNTKGNRCQVLGLRPARNQAHWLGFIGTMGSAYYDYIIADDIVAPLANQDDFVEKILQIPAGFHVADDVRVVEPTRETRAALGLPEEGVVFGCFAQTFKIQPEHFDRWMQILKQVPGSVIWMASGPKGATANLKAEMQKQGIDPARMVIAERCSRAEYLSRFELMDIHLDTFPYTSGTVASDALYGGCPLLTLSGTTMVSKMAGSILSHAGFPELVARTPEEFVQKAIDLANDEAEMMRIRGELLQMRNSGTLLPVKKIVEDLEQAVKNVLS